MHVEGVLVEGVLAMWRLQCGVLVWRCACTVTSTACDDTLHYWRRIFEMLWLDHPETSSLISRTDARLSILDVLWWRVSSRCLVAASARLQPTSIISRPCVPFPSPPLTPKDEYVPDAGNLLINVPPVEAIVAPSMLFGDTVIENYPLYDQSHEQLFYDHYSKMEYVTV